MPQIGALLFGVVVGWLTYRTIRRAPSTGISDLAAVIAAVGGGVLTTVFRGAAEFNDYCIGLFIGFFAYFIVAAFVPQASAAGGWLGNDPS